MKLLLEINDKHIGWADIESFTQPYKLRKAARAVIFNDKQEIAIEYVSKHNYHKLPGGGLESGENIETALQREAMEEVGCQIQVNNEVGITIEYRNQQSMLQISYCYLAKVVGDIETPEYDESELERGFQLIWVSIDKAIELLSKDQPDIYNAKFIQKRDLVILQEAQRIHAL